MNEIIFDHCERDMTEYNECPVSEFKETNERNNRNVKKPTAIKWLRKNILLLITLFGVLLGVIIGFFLRKLELSETTVLLVSYPGELYMRALKLLILPLIISSLITGSSSINARLNGKIALRTFIYFFLTSCFNAFLGVILTVIMHPGNTGIKITLNDIVDEKKGTSVLDSLLDLGRNIVADNIFQATFQQSHTEIVNTTIRILSKNNETFEVVNKIEKILNYKMGTNNIGIVFFCIVFGSILGTTGPKGTVVKEFCSTIFDVVMKMVRGVIWVTPFGLCSIIAGKIVSVANLTLVITQLGWFIVTIILGVFLYQLVFLQLIYFVIVKKNPFKYYVSFVQGTLTAFATASTAAVLPINFDIMDYELKLNKSVSRFVMPIGCNINMDGTAMFLATATIFMAQMDGHSLQTGTLVTVWLTCTIMSFSSASVPSAALVLLYMVLTSIGISVRNLPLLFAVDWLVDRFRTTNNMLGDCYTVAVVEKWSKNELTLNTQEDRVNKTEETLKNLLTKFEEEVQIV